jgi:hypothetical protein
MFGCIYPDMCIAYNQSSGLATLKTPIFLQEKLQLQHIWETIALTLDRSFLKTVASHVYFCSKCSTVNVTRIIQGGGGGRPPTPPPLKLGKNMIFFWRKIVIFHTKYPKNVRASLRNWEKYDFLA